MTHAEMLAMLAAIDNEKRKTHEAAYRLALYCEPPSVYEAEIDRVARMTHDEMRMADDGCPNGND